jgi:hypothetical protein
LLADLVKMALRNLKSSDAPSGADDPDADLSELLTSDECAAIRAAAAAEGFSETFADLLCKFAELIGAEQVLLELGHLKGLLKDDPH